MPGIEEQTLLNLAEAIREDAELLKLGPKLGFKQTQIKSYIKTNRIDGDAGWKGTCNMLFDWKRRTPKADQLTKLKEALIDAELVEYVEDYLGAEGTGGSGANASQPSTSTQGGRTASGSSGERVEDDFLNDIVEDFPNANFSKICKGLGWSENRAQNELEKYKHDYTKTYRNALQGWKNKTGGTKGELVEVLKNAGYTLRI